MPDPTKLNEQAEGNFLGQIMTTDGASKGYLGVTCDATKRKLVTSRDGIDHLPPGKYTIEPSIDIRLLQCATSAALATAMSGGLASSGVRCPAGQETTIFVAANGAGGWICWVKHEDWAGAATGHGDIHTRQYFASTGPVDP